MIPLRQIRDNTDPKAFPIRIKDKSNEPLLKLGSAVLASPSIRWKPGYMCVVELKSGKKIIGFAKWADFFDGTRRIRKARLNVEPYASYWATQTGKPSTSRYSIQVLKRKEIRRIYGIRQMIFG